MQLLTAPPSPFARKARICLVEAGLADAVEEVNVAASALAPDPAITSHNPLGKIPALIREDGPALYDSRVICRWLDARAGAGLYPEARLWDTLTLEATADGIMDAAALIVYEHRFRPEPHRSEDWIEGQWDKIARALDTLEARWMSHLAGRLDMGQIALGCALGYLDFRHADRPWRAGRGALDDWYAVFAERPSMKATRPA